MTALVARCIGLLFLGWSVVAVCDPVTLRITIPNAHGSVGPNGGQRPFTASYVTFTATGDSDALYQPYPGHPEALAFDAIVTATIPGITSDASANVRIFVPLSGALDFDFCPLSPFTPCGVRATSPALSAYQFPFTFGPTTVDAYTYNAFPVGGAVFLRVGDGETLVVSAQDHAAGILEISPAAGAISVPTVSVSALMLLAVLLAVAGCFRLLHVQRLTSQPTPPGGPRSV